MQRMIVHYQNKRRKKEGGGGEEEERRREKALDALTTFHLFEVTKELVDKYAVVCRSARSSIQINLFQLPPACAKSPLTHPITL